MYWRYHNVNSTKELYYYYQNNGLSMFSIFHVVYLWEQKGKDLTKLDWKRHRFGVTYLTVTNDCTIEQIDDIVSVTYYKRLL